MAERIWLALIAPLLLSTTAEEPTFHAAEGTELMRTFTSEGTLQLDDMNVTVAGNEHNFGEFEVRAERVRTLVVRDVYGALGDGRPARLVRTYETIEGSRVENSTTPAGESGSQETHLASDLEGRTVAFAWDEDEEQYATSFEDDGDDDDELLEGLVEDMDLRAFLPGREVEEGDSWDVDATAFGLIRSSGGVRLVEDETEDPEGDLALEVALEEALEGELTATYRGTREEDGRTVAVIELAAQVETEAEQPMERESGEVQVTISISYDMEGELLWDMEGGHLFSLELSGPMEYTVVEESVFVDPNGGEHDVVKTMSLSGDERFEASVERG